MTVDIEKLEALAKACGNLNWRAIQENWCEWAIRDDHAYIAIMRTKSAKQAGPCSDREAKAKFLCAVTPSAVLELIADHERLRNLAQSEIDKHGESAKEVMGARMTLHTLEQERNQLKAENDRLRESHEQICTNYNQVSYASEELGKQRDHLKAELAGLKTGYEAYERVNAELRAECEALRSKFENPDPILIQCMDSAIAEQEQLEKDAKRYRWLRNSAGSADWEFFGHQGKEATDHNIDAAMSEEASHD